MAMRAAVLFLSLTVLGSRAEAAPREGFFTTTDGARIRYVDAGRGASMVFVPGWTMPAEVWEAQIRHFSGRYQVVAMDPRSQGGSAHVNDGHYPERRARDILELVQERKLAPAVLVGWSMGVAELLTLVRDHGTAAVRALVLVDGWVGRDPDPKIAAQVLARIRALQTQRAEFTDGLVRSMFRRPQTKALIQAIVEASLRMPTNSAAALLAGVYAVGDWRPILTKIDRPVLYVGRGGSTPQAKEVLARLPSARIEIFEDAGHALFVDEPARFNQVLEKFLHSLPP
jgi:microsomal epoxide hydrolase